MSRRDAGEVLLWLGIAAMLVAAAEVRLLSGNQFVGLFAAGVGALLAGLVLTYGPRRPR